MTQKAQPTTDQILFDSDYFLSPKSKLNYIITSLNFNRLLYFKTEKKTQVFLCHYFIVICQENVVFVF